MKSFLLLFCAVVMVDICMAGAPPITSLASGNWSDVAIWDSGIVPTATDDVIIAATHVVTVDIDAACKDIEIDGHLTFPGVAGKTIIFNGSVSIGATGFLNVYETGSPTGIVYQTLFFYKDLTIASGGRLDMRRGSGGNVSVGRVTFAGAISSTISLSQTTYGSSIEEFNSVVINKTGGAKVILASGNLFQNNNSSTAADTLLFVSGMIETGGNRWIHLATASAAISGVSATCYVNGILGRGMSNSAGSNRRIDIGDQFGYRPISVQSTTSGSATGHYTWARILHQNANTGSSILNGSLVKVAENRYYQVGYFAGGGAASMSYAWFRPTYDANDGVVAGNSELRVAYSTDQRANWNNLGPSTHVTSLASPPTQIQSDSLAAASVIVLNSGDSICVALGAIAGGSNPLPVELQSFVARTARGSVELSWSTATETANAGFEIERRSSSDVWTGIAFVKGAGTSAVQNKYSYTDKELPAGSYSYRLKQIDRDGRFTHSAVVEAKVIGMPKELSLADAYPNPFNPTTTITFTVPQNGAVSLKVFNVIGQQVATLFNGVAEAERSYQAAFDAGSFASGLYFARLEFCGQSLMKKMILSK